MNLDQEFHPLFLPKEGGPDDYEPMEFNSIMVTRLECNGPLKGREKPKTQAMRLYHPEELGSLELFHREFGGGSYEICALLKNGRRYAVRYLQLPGDSKPLAPTSIGETPVTLPWPTVTRIASAPRRSVNCHVGTTWFKGRSAPTTVQPL